MTDHDEPAPRITDSETLLRRVGDIISSAKTMPLSSSAMVNREELLELLDDALARLPEELKAARWMLREREDFIAKSRREADDILDAARVQAERMVQRTEVVRQAEARARQVLDHANDEARRLRHEVEDFCDQRLAQFEIVLERVQKLVQAGRERLAATGMTRPEQGGESEATEAESAFFDQDRS